jgi:hypothetical protein
MVRTAVQREYVASDQRTSKRVANVPARRMGRRSAKREIPRILMENPESQIKSGGLTR